ncbi:TcdA/TcdB catalytic glycosyltransferase domain-containing protein [Pantoea sp. OXWO6B1]|uniref:TcdA/TcdB catalytic glycosyltransferase domain-containing protein n=1 Tax=Pantoea sp. OXWO6B1 TaxID=1835724 RepID=UPI0007C86953|nr:TcdA/TcdB catalytic glycosyltransferase domain-containing protein [Pantoea sp. OXWO6B1]OAD97845.1 hypothetical protein A6A26_21900 [Pantoea sp. OXWO6B1]
MNAFLKTSLSKDNIALPAFVVNPFSSLFDRVVTFSRKDIRHQNLSSLYINLRDFFTGLARGRAEVKDIFLVYEFLYHLQSSLPEVKTDECVETLHIVLSQSSGGKNLNSLPKDIHFIWLGPLAPGTLDFAKFWKKINPGYTVHLWTDKRILSAGINGRMRNKKGGVISESGIITAFRTASYHYLPPPYSRQRPSGISLMAATSCPVVVSEISGESSVTGTPDVIMTHDVSEIFNQIFSRPFLKIYMFEVFFRKNLAAASDIFRMLLLYSRGGIYVDTDTLPGLIHFSERFKTDAYSHLPVKDYDSREKLDVGMTNESLSLLQNGGDFCHTDFADDNYRFFLSVKKQLIRCTDIGCHPFFYTLDDVQIPDGNFLIARDHSRERVFFSNFIASTARNAFTENALYMLKRNYEKLGLSALLDRALKKPVLSEDFTEYFYDGYLNNSLKTLYISGPGVLIHAGLMFLMQRYDLPPDFDRNVLLSILWNTWGTSQHSINNATGFKSTWRDK